MIKIVNNGNEQVIELYGEIGNSFWGEGWTFERFKNELKSMSAPSVVVEIKSNGGDVFEAFAIHDEIKAMKSRVTAKIVGNSASAATIIAAAADRVQITENSRYLVHNAHTFVEGNKEQIGSVYDQLESIDNQILGIYVKRTGKNSDLLANLMSEERWMTAQEALEWGFVDEIIEYKPKIQNNMAEKTKVTNMTEEEKEQMDALKAEIETLKAKLAEKDEEIENFKAEKEQKEDEEIDAEVTALIESGKFKADAKDSMIALAKTNRNAFKAVVSSVQTVATSVNLLSVPSQKNAEPDKPQPKTKSEAWALYAAGTIGTHTDYLAIIKDMEG
jgi:ATP-dependent Clp protease, protease subunit